MGTRSKTHAFRKSRPPKDPANEHNRTLAFAAAFVFITFAMVVLVFWVVSWWRGLG